MELQLREGTKKKCVMKDRAKGIILLIVDGTWLTHYEEIIGTFRSEDEDDYEYEFSILSMRIRFGGRHCFEVRELRTETSYSYSSSSSDLKVPNNH